MTDRRQGVAAAVLALLGLASGAKAAAEARLRAELKACPFKIVYESFRDGNWELMAMNADGSGRRNLTNTPDIDEMFPHASPDGTKVAFVAETGKGKARTRDVYWMSLDGAGPRVKVGQSGRQPFWCPGGRRIGFVRGTHVTYGEGGNANKELYFYDIEARTIACHPNQAIAGLLNPCMSPDGAWTIASAMGGMGFAASIIAVETKGSRVVELARSHSEAKNVYQCRPDISPDGTRVAWGKDDVDNHYGFGHRTMFVEVGDIDLNAPTPKVTHRRYAVTVKHPLETYHVDWSPDGRYIAYSQGSRGLGRMARAHFVVGAKAEGWDIWVVKPSEPEVAVQLTHDGLSNKEPDWISVPHNRTGDTQ